MFMWPNPVSRKLQALSLRRNRRRVKEGNRTMEDLRRTMLIPIERICTSILGRRQIIIIKHLKIFSEFLVEQDEYIWEIMSNYNEEYWHLQVGAAE